MLITDKDNKKICACKDICACHIECDVSRLYTPKAFPDCTLPKRFYVSRLYTPKADKKVFQMQTVSTPIAPIYTLLFYMKNDNIKKIDNQITVVSSGSRQFLTHLTIFFAVNIMLGTINILNFITPRFRLYFTFNITGVIFLCLHITKEKH